MSTPGHFKIACANCQGHIEFPKELHGQTIDCPHCGLSTVLRVPGFVESLPTPAPTAPISLDQPPSIAQTPQIQDDTINPAPQLGLPEITDESFRSTKVRS
jgi:DNA-directed RNA polymerase subunit RPC12/RpoP